MNCTVYFPRDWDRLNRFLWLRRYGYVIYRKLLPDGGWRIVS